MTKTIIFDTEAISGLKRGVDALADAVKVTLGPKGRNVIIERSNGVPHITKDGVTVAHEIFLEDPIENLGAKVVKEVSSNTAELAGDGTTTATVLAQAIVGEGLKNVIAGANPMDLKRGIDRAVEAVVASLSEQALPLKANDKQAIKNIGTISANGDESIGELIADAMIQVGQDGIVTVEESKSAETYVELVEGVEIAGNGYISPYFVTNVTKLTCELDNPYVLLYDGTISNVNEIVPMMEAVAKQGRSLVIVADEVSGSALNALVVNKMNGNLRAVAVKAPGYGLHRQASLEDLAVVLNASVVSPTKGLHLDEATFEDLGYCDKVRVGKSSTTFIGGGGNTPAIEERKEQIKSLIEQEENPREVQILQLRLRRIAGGVAVLYVGATSEIELKEKRDRIDDALHATRAAVEEGIIPGGGTAYIRALKSIKGLKGANQDQNTGIDIIRKAITAPLFHIANNAGLHGDVIVAEVAKRKNHIGFNAASGRFVDMIKSGIVDPKKVARVAIENAGSVAGLLLTTNCVIVNKAREQN